MLEKVDHRGADCRESIGKEESRVVKKAAQRPVSPRKARCSGSWPASPEANADEGISVALQEKIINFLYDLTQRPDKFVENLMRLLHEHFQFRNTVFLYPGNACDLRDSYLSAKFFTDCVDHYVENGVVKVASKQKDNLYFPVSPLRHERLPAEFRDRNVIFSSDLPHESVLREEYDDIRSLFSQQAFTFFATMKLAFPGDTYLARIFFAKTDAEGDFTHKERHILQTIAKHIAYNYHFAIDYYYKVEKIKLFDKLNSYLSTGLIAVNSKLQVFCANKVSYEYCIDILDYNKVHIAKSSTNRVMLQQMLIDMISDNITSVLNEGSTKFICTEYVYIIKGVSCIVQDYKNDLIPYHFFYITRKDNNGSTNFEMFAHKYNLSCRELEILTMLDCGSNVKEISAELYISRHTVKTHISNIFRKVNVGCRAALLHKLRHDKQDDPAGRPGRDRADIPLRAGKGGKPPQNGRGAAPQGCPADS
ncbi:MAG: helix-turn-helix transcriptional regulator [Desulfovibrio sp.]|nr:helix-turn-helix transcriptional regulator [Desulfovibrio sp.]